MNNKDVIKMQKAGLSEETIISTIQKEQPDYDTKPRRDHRAQVGWCFRAS